MSISISKKSAIPAKSNQVHLLNKISDLSSVGLAKDELAFAKNELKSSGQSSINRYSHWVYLILPKKKEKVEHHRLESLRKTGAQFATLLNKTKAQSVTIRGAEGKDVYALAEGMALMNYQFLKYFKDAKTKKNSLKKINVVGGMTAIMTTELQANVDAVYHTRDLVNEPLSFLTAPQLATEIKKLGKKAGFKVDVFNKKKIESLKMGGLLAVNRGSVDPPTFTVMEWKPKGAKNKKPIVLVGKGVVYDTGGVSLKPTANSMDMMKCDMAGAAMMIGTMYAISKAKLPVHVVGLIPATDNRPGLNAYVPGDVVKMHNGMTVEVLNTDAEGRMLLADALSYAKKYKPELVFDAATLTGAAVRAIGSVASCVMGTAGDKDFSKLQKSGENTYERVVRMPFWSEYGEQIKSDVADIKNLGGATAGQITAGKFLEHFTDYPWIHIDIAGPSYITSPDSYRGKWGTGYGVRLLFDMLKNR
jgi:leucyl aminopeptidase